MQFEVTLSYGKYLTVAAHMSCLDTALFFQWPQIADNRKVDELTRIHRDITPTSFVLHRRHVGLCQGVAPVLNFANEYTDINKQPGWDLTVWAHHGAFLDTVTQNS